MEKEQVIFIHTQPLKPSSSSRTSKEQDHDTTKPVGTKIDDKEEEKTLLAHANTIYDDFMQVSVKITKAKAFITLHDKSLLKEDRVMVESYQQEKLTKLEQVKREAKSIAQTLNASLPGKKAILVFFSEENASSMRVEKIKKDILELEAMVTKLNIILS